MIASATSIASYVSPILAGLVIVGAASIPALRIWATRRRTREIQEILATMSEVQASMAQLHDRLAQPRSVDRPLAPSASMVMAARAQWAELALANPIEHLVEIATANLEPRGIGLKPVLRTGPKLSPLRIGHQRGSAQLARKWVITESPSPLYEEYAVAAPDWFEDLTIKTKH